MCRYVGNVRHLRPFLMNMDKYKYKTNQEKAPTIEVTVPSGNIFLFRKPSKFALMFRIKNMPASLTEAAIEKWREQGIGNTEEDAEVLAQEAFQNGSQEDRMRMFEANLTIRDKVLELSVEPKLVLNRTDNENELCVDDVADEDLGYLFNWVASGGVAPMLATFPKRSEQDTLASASRKTRQPKAVAVGGTE